MQGVTVPVGRLKRPQPLCEDSPKRQGLGSAKVCSWQETRQEAGAGRQG